MHRLLCIVVLLVPQILWAQLPPPPPPPQTPIRDSPSGPAVKGKGSIRGRITSADAGKPLRRARVSVSGAPLTEARTATTDMSGRYEIKDLPPGRYTVRVTRSGYLPLSHGQRRPGEAGKPLELGEGQIAEKIDFSLPRMGVISGRVMDEMGEPVAEAQVYAMDVQYYRGQRRMVPTGGVTRTDDAGQYRILGLLPGSYSVMVSFRETWHLDNDPTQVMSYMPSYYPSTPTASEAQRVTVGLGQEVGAIDITLVPGRTATVSGLAMSSSGGPIAGHTVSIMQIISGPTMSSSMGVGSAKTSPDGSWVVRNVSPGEYQISLRTTGQTPVESAEATIVVTGGDVEGVMLLAGSGGSVRGQVVSEDGSPLSDLERMYIGARGNTDFRMRAPGSPDDGRVSKEGAVEWKGVHGPTTFTLSQVPAGWALKAIEYEGREFSDTPIEVKHGDTITGVRFVLTNRPTIVMGVLRETKTKTVTEGTVILFSTDSAKWRDGSRMIRSARPDQNGRFEVKGLPPGEYFAVALDYVRDGQWNDPEFLDELKSRAEKFSIAESEAKQVDLVVQK